MERTTALTRPATTCVTWFQAMSEVRKISEDGFHCPGISSREGQNLKECHERRAVVDRLDSLAPVDLTAGPYHT